MQNSINLVGLTKAASFFNQDAPSSPDFSEIASEYVTPVLGGAALGQGAGGLAQLQSYLGQHSDRGLKALENINEATSKDLSKLEKFLDKRNLLKHKAVESGFGVLAKTDHAARILNHLLSGKKALIGAGIGAGIGSIGALANALSSDEQ